MVVVAHFTTTQAHLEGGHLPVPGGHDLPRGRQAGIEREPVDSQVAFILHLGDVHGAWGVWGTDEGWMGVDSHLDWLPLTLQQSTLC